MRDANTALTEWRARWRARRLGASQKESVALSVLRRMESTLNGLPFKWVGLFAFAVGCTSLFGYLHAIDYVPPNVLGLVGLAGIASVWLLVLLIAMTVLMFGATALVSILEFNSLDWLAVLVGQTGALLTVAAWVAIGQSPWAPFVMGTLGIGAMAWTVNRLHAGRSSKVEDFILAVTALFLGGLCLVLGVLFVIQSMADYEYTQNIGFWRLASWVLVMFALIVVNAAAAHFKAAPVVFWSSALLATAAMVLAVAGPGFVVTIVASKVGLRLPRVVELQVPQSTCKAVLSAIESKSSLADAGPVPTPLCVDGANFMSAIVQLRWGDRWLIIAKSINGIHLPDRGGRLTIPDKDTELIFH